LPTTVCWIHWYFSTLTSLSLTEKRKTERSFQLVQFFFYIRIHSVFHNFLSLFNCF
jgi:hypothetical protein